MRQGFGCALIVACLALAGAGNASAGSARAHKASRGYAAAPVKDCTPFNGRWGYYGNPWCTATEQDRWNRWDANRHALR